LNFPPPAQPSRCFDAGDRCCVRGGPPPLVAAENNWGHESGSPNLRLRPRVPPGIKPGLVAISQEPPFKDLDGLTFSVNFAAGRGFRQHLAGRQSPPRPEGIFSPPMFFPSSSFGGGPSPEIVLSPPALQPAWRPPLFTRPRRGGVTPQLLF